MQIPVVADLPVGENLQDHVMADGVEFYSPYYMSLTPARAENFASSWQHTLYGGGKPFSSIFCEYMRQV